MSFNVLTASLATHSSGYDNVEDAMNQAAAAVKDQPNDVAVVVDTDNDGAVLVIHDGYAYLADAAPEVEE